MNFSYRKFLLCSNSVFKQLKCFLHIRGPVRHFFSGSNFQKINLTSLLHLHLPYAVFQFIPYFQNIQSFSNFLVFYILYIIAIQNILVPSSILSNKFAVTLTSLCDFCTVLCQPIITMQRALLYINLSFSHLKLREIWGIHLVHDIITISVSTFKGFIVTCASLCDVFPIFPYFQIIFSVSISIKLLFLLLLSRLCLVLSIKNNGITLLLFASCFLH